MDKGLISSNYGIVVLSPNFFQKDWPEYELRGLFAKEIGNNKVILPVWHQIDIEQLLNYSAILADKYALSSSKLNISEIAIKITEVVRPDIFKNIIRKLAYFDMLKEGKRAFVPIESLKPSPIRHENLSSSFVNRIRLIRASLLNVYPKSMEFWLDGFKRDLNPESEIAVWERIAAVFLEYSNYQELSTEQKHTAFSVIVQLSMGFTSEEFKNDPKEFPSGGFKTINQLMRNDIPSVNFDDDSK